MTNDFNDGADYWYHEMGLNVIPSDTRNKKPVLSQHKEYQNKRIPKDVYESWKRDNYFEQGHGNLSYRVYLEGKDLFWVSIDCDSKQAISEFCLNNDGSLEELAKRFVIEQQADNLDRAYISFLSPIAFPQKGADAKLGLEVKSKGEHGIMCSAPSIHIDGEPYRIIGTKKPVVLDNLQSINMIRKLDRICAKHGLEYLQRKSGLDPKRKDIIRKLDVTGESGISINEGKGMPPFCPLPIPYCLPITTNMAMTPRRYEIFS